MLKFSSRIKEYRQEFENTGSKRQKKAAQELPWTAFFFVSILFYGLARYPSHFTFVLVWFIR